MSLPKCKPKMAASNQNGRLPFELAVFVPYLFARIVRHVDCPPMLMKLAPGADLSCATTLHFHSQKSESCFVIQAHMLTMSACPLFSFPKTKPSLDDSDTKCRGFVQHNNCSPGEVTGLA